MAQFDVLKNPERQRDAIPFVVVLRNSRFDKAATRFVAPLILASLTEAVQQVASLADEASRAKLTRALDELVSRA